MVKITVSHPVEWIRTVGRVYGATEILRYDFLFFLMKLTHTRHFTTSTVIESAGNCVGHMKGINNRQEDFVPLCVFYFLFQLHSKPYFSV